MHAWLAWLGVVVVPNQAFWDVDLYRWWMQQGLEQSTWPVLDEPWVYPVGAMLPMLAAALAGVGSQPAYALGWCVLVTLLDAVAVAALLPRRVTTAHGGTPVGSAKGAWFWLAFLAMLGPVGIGRLDGIIAPLMVLALVAARRRPALAATIATVGAWVKVAPGALVLPLLAAARRPLRQVVAPATAVCAVVVGAVAALGGLAGIASFVGKQGERGLQIEAVGATPWMLARHWRDDITVQLDTEIITFQVYGPGTSAAAAVLDVLLVLGVALVAALLWRARLDGRAAEVVLPASLALMTLLIVTNKVGSPQFLAWLAPPVAVLLSRPGRVRQEWLGAVWRAVLACAPLTQTLFPWTYPELVIGYGLMTGLLVVRNVLLVLVLVLALRPLLPQRAGQGEPPAPPADAAGDPTPSAEEREDAPAPQT